jgi:hypothetical protein
VAFLSLPVKKLQEKKEAMSMDTLFVIGVFAVLVLLVLEIRRINRRYLNTHKSIAKILLSYLGATSLAVIIYTIYAFAVILFTHR